MTHVYYRISLNTIAQAKPYCLKDYIITEENYHQIVQRHLSGKSYILNVPSKSSEPVATDFEFIVNPQKIGLFATQLIVGDERADEYQPQPIYVGG